MKKYPWNEKLVVSHFWDHEGEGREVSKTNTLREQLTNIQFAKYDDTLRNCTEALVMIMDYLEKEGDRLKDKK